MKTFVKKALSLVVCLALIVGLVPLTSVLAADIEQSSYMKYMTNNSMLDTGYGAYGAYDVQGYYNGSWLQTTYYNAGYRTHVKVGASSVTSLTYMANGVEKVVVGTGLAITQNLSLVFNGRYVKIQYVVRNTTSAPLTMSLGSGADVQIGSNDYAPITKFEDGSGFYMTDGYGAQFNFIGKNAYGVTDVDAFWFGHYGSVDANMFSSINQTSLSGTDSGMTYSWNNRTIAAGSSQSFSVLIGIGAVNKAPVLSVNLSAITNAGTVTPGQVIPITGSFTDHEGTTGTQIYYVIDNSTPVLAHTAGAPGSFTANITIPAGISGGNHTLSVYAQDQDGSVSNVATTTFRVPAPPVLAITSPTGDIKLSKENGNTTFTLSGTVSSDSTVRVSATINGVEKYVMVPPSASGNWSLSWDALTDSLPQGSTTVTVTAVNADGMVNKTWSKNLSVDTTAPTVDIAPTHTGWTNSDVTLIITATDTNGLAAAPYSFDGGATWQTGSFKTYSSNTTIAAGTILVKDSYGNITANSVPIVIDYIDKEAPTFTANDVSYAKLNDSPLERFAHWLTFGLFFKETVRVQVDVNDDGAGVAKLWYVLGNNAPAYTTTKSNGKYIFDITVDSAFEGDIVLYAEDALGNITPFAQRVTLSNFSVENVAPTLTVTPDSTAGSKGWYGDEVDFTIRAKDDTAGLYSVLVEVNGVKQPCSIDSFSTQVRTEQVITLPNVGSIPSANGEYVVRVTVTDNAGNQTVSEQTIKVDKQTPVVAITGTDGQWTNKPVTLQFANISDTLTAGYTIYYTTAADDSAWVEGTSVTVDNNFNGVYRVKIVSDAGHVAILSQAVKVALSGDFTVTGAEEGSDYGIARKIEVAAGFAPIASITYTVNGGESKPMPASGILTDVGTILVTVTDEAGNTCTLTYTVAAIRAVDTVTRTEESKQKIEALRAEFNAQKGALSGDALYLEATDAAITALEQTYNQLHIDAITAALASLTTDNVNSSHSATLGQAAADIAVLPLLGTLTSEQRSALDALLERINAMNTTLNTVRTDREAALSSSAALIEKNINSADKQGLEDSLAAIEALLNKNNLTTEERQALTDAKNALLRQSDIVTDVRGDIDDVKTKTDGKTAETVTLADKADLQSALETVEALLADKHLTDEERSTLEQTKTTIEDLLGLIAQVEAVITQIDGLPEADVVQKSDKDAIIQAQNGYNALNDKQKSLIDEAHTKKLTDVVAALTKLLLYHPATSTSVEGVGGTAFDPATELVVELVTNILPDVDKTKFNSNIKLTLGNGDQELVDLFDIRLLLNNEPIQPGGPVRVRIKLTERQLNFTDLQVVYIADDGKVTVIPHTIENGYVVFITDHFSHYGIAGVAPVNPDTGEQGYPVVLMVTAASLLAVLVVARKRHSASL